MSRLQTAPFPSPQELWMLFILSTDLHIPLHCQSKDATHTFPSSAFHSQSIIFPFRIILYIYVIYDSQKKKKKKLDFKFYQIKRPPNKSKKEKKEKKKEEKEQYKDLLSNIVYYRVKCKVGTWRGPTTHGAVVYMFHFKAYEP